MILMPRYYLPGHYKLADERTGIVIPKCFLVKSGSRQNGYYLQSDSNKGEPLLISPCPDDITSLRLVKMNTGYIFYAKKEYSYLIYAVVDKKTNLLGHCQASDNPDAFIVGTSNGLNSSTWALIRQGKLIPIEKDTHVEPYPFYQSVTHCDDLTLVIIGLQEGELFAYRFIYENGKYRQTTTDAIKAQLIAYQSRVDSLVAIKDTPDATIINLKNDGQLMGQLTINHIDNTSINHEFGDK